MSSTCPTLGIPSSSNVWSRSVDTSGGPLTFNCNAVACATVTNQFWSNTSSSTPDTRTGTVQFYWKNTSGVSVGISPEPPSSNPTTVEGPSSPSVPFGQNGTATMYWQANAANLGLISNNVVILIGQVLAVVSTAADVICASVSSTTSSPWPYAVASARYTIQIPTSVQLEEIHRRSVRHDSVLRQVAFVVYNPSDRTETVRISARPWLPANASSQARCWAMPKIAYGVGKVDREVCEVQAGLVSHLDDPPLVGLEPVTIELGSGLARQGLVDALLPEALLRDECYKAGFIEVCQHALRDGRWHLTNQFFVGLSNDPKCPVWSDCPASGGSFASFR